MSVAPAVPASPPSALAADCHAVARLCACTQAEALALLSQAQGLARWNLGLWHTREAAPGLLTGTSLFDGGTGQVRVVLNAAEGTVSYAVGGHEQALQSRIQARVQPGQALGYGAGQCIVTLLAWRPAGMDDARWQRLKAAHEVEIDLICGQLQAAA